MFYRIRVYKEYPRSLPRGGGEDERHTLPAKDQRPTLIQRTLTGEPAEAKCHCRKVCKNFRGLKIHQSRTMCGKAKNQRQHSSQQLGETEEVSIQDTPHSIGDLLATELSHDSTIASAMEERIDGDLDESDDPLLHLLSTSTDSTTPSCNYSAPNTTTKDDQRRKKIQASGQAQTKGRIGRSWTPT